jgi:hypothetical protein
MTLLQGKRAWLGGGALVALLIVVVSWFMVISPELSAAAALRTQATDADLQNSVTQGKVAKLRLQAEHLGELTTSLASALEALPTSSGLPAFTRQLSAQGTLSHVDVTSIVIGSISSVNADGATGTTPTTTTPAPTATAPANAGSTSAGSVYAIPVTVISSGSLTHELAFLKAIQTLGPRRALLTSTQFAPRGGGAQGASIDRSATVTVQLTVFSAP